MITKPIHTPICGEHHVEKEWRPTTFEYSDEGITVRVPDVYAWVCPENGEASFTPDTVDELITTVRELIELAKRARERRPVLTEYIVSIGV
jgi:YgiT-type zinc finger domain-containing protein